MGRPIFYLAVVYVNLALTGVFYAVNGLFTGDGGIADARAVTDWLLTPALIVTLVLFVVAAVLLIRDALARLRAGDAVGLRRSMAVLKFGLVPFFVVNFVHLGFWMIVISGVTLGAGWLLLPVVVVMTYLVFLPTSAPGLAYLALLARERRMSAGMVALHVVLHLTYVLDLVSTAVLLAAARAPGGRVPGPQGPRPGASGQPPRRG